MPASEVSGINLPAAASAIAVSISGAVLDGTVVDSIILRNSGSADVTNVFVAGYIPTGATFSGASTPPADTAFVGADQGGASWIAPNPLREPLVCGAGQELVDGEIPNCRDDGDSGGG